MDAQLDLTVRGMARTTEMEEAVRERFNELVLLDSRISECQVLVELTRRKLQYGNPFRVVINLKLHYAPGIVVRREPSGLSMRDPLDATLHNAFTIVKRKLVDKAGRIQHTQARPQAEYGAIVSRIFRDKGYGFLRTDSGRSIFFHRNSVLGDEFDLMEEGTGVWFIERESEKGPWASTVRICASAS